MRPRRIVSLFVSRTAATMLATAGAVGVSAVAAGPAGALGSAGDSAYCVYSGVGGSISPAIPPASEGTVDNTGTYQFSGGPQAVAPGVYEPCGGVFGGHTYSTTSSTAISSTGSYVNYIVGTGDATGTSTITARSGEVDCNYSVAFTGGNGVLVGDCTAYTVSGTVKTAQSSFPLWGFDQIAPTNTTSGGGVTQPVSSFQVNGWSFGEWAAGQADLYAVSPFATAGLTKSGDWWPVLPVPCTNKAQANDCPN